MERSADRRITRTVGGASAGYVYDGWNVVHTHAAGSINATLLNGLGLDERYARTNAGGTVAFLSDALGSTLHLRSAGGANTATTTYEPYGAATSSGTDSTAFGYTGREDDDNGLMYYRNRYYHPRFSRFISEDPIGLAGGDNAYRYVDGHPSDGTDPLGLRNAQANLVRELLGLSRRDRPESVDQMARRHEKDFWKKAEREWGDRLPRIPWTNNEPWCYLECPDEGFVCRAAPSSGVASFSAPGCYVVCQSGPFASAPR